MRRAPLLLPLTALLLVTACSGGPGDPPAGRTGAPSPSLPAAPAPAMRLVSYGGCDELLRELRSTAADLVGPNGLEGGYYGPMARAEFQDLAGASVSKDFAPAAGEQSYSGTNVAEQGVDEPDLVKTDGARIVTVADGSLRVVDTATRRQTQEIDLPTDFTGPLDLLLQGDTALVLVRGSAAPSFRPTYPGGGSGRYRLLQVDLRAGRVAGELKGEGEIVDARQVGPVARVVVRTRPDLVFPQRRIDGQKDVKAAIAANEKIAKAAPLEAFQPAYKLTVDGRATEHRVPCERISRAKGDENVTMLNVLTFDLNRGLTNGDPVTVVAEGDTVYGTGTSLYVAGAPAARDILQWKRDAGKRPKPSATQVHKFTITGTGRPVYAASGEVPGRILNQYSLSEHGGDLRIATTEDARGGKKQQSAVRILAPAGPALTEIGKVTGLGKDEAAYAVRFAGDRGYVVTFRQTDPLYVLDLADPRHPVLRGELKITGYSAYLHPTGDGRILGVGQAADARGRLEGAQVTLFDVKDAPKAVSRLDLEKVWNTLVEWDQHAFLHWPATGLTVLPAGDGTALALTVGGEKVTKIGTIDASRGALLRALVVGPVLWTVSAEGLRAVDPKTLDEQTWVKF